MTGLNHPHPTLNHLAAAVCAVLLSVAPLAYAHALARQSALALDSASPNPVQSGRAAQKIIQAAAAFSYIPQDEVPTVLLVTDPRPLAALLLAEPGDMVLVYRQSDLLVLFDPHTENVINVIAASGVL